MLRFDQISCTKHDIYLYGKLSTKLLAKAAYKNIKFMFKKTERLFFFLIMASEVAARKNSKQTIPDVEKSNCPESRHRVLDSYS